MGILLDILSGIGNTLDVPGSMVRDALGGENPFDQLMAPWRSNNRLSGRDLNRRWGLAGQQDTWGNLAGGIGIELATDPLNLLPGLGLVKRALQGSKIARATKAVDQANSLSQAMRLKGWMPEEVARATKLPGRFEHSTAGPVFGVREFASDAGTGNWLGKGVYFGKHPGETSQYARYTKKGIEESSSAPRTMMAYIDSRSPFQFEQPATLADMIAAKRATNKAWGQYAGSRPGMLTNELRQLKSTGRPIRNSDLWLAMRENGLTSDDISDVIRSRGYDAITHEVGISQDVSDAWKAMHPNASKYDFPPTLDAHSETLVFDPSQIYEPFIAPAMRARPEQLRKIPRSLKAAFAAYQAGVTPSRGRSQE